MSTWLLTHPVCIEHDTGRGHPERPDRLRSVLEALAGDAFAALYHQTTEPATREQLAYVHDDAHIERTLAAIPASGQANLDGDTIVSPHSGEAALQAAGAGCQAVDAVLAGQAQRVFCAVRPPGHHAEPDRPMGFCLFNNIAIAAMHARVVHGVERVAIVDFDVHHGNGTEAMLPSHPGLFYASTHQSPLFPGTGFRADNLPGRLHNYPLAAGAGSADFRAAYEDTILPELRAFQPELVLLSTGFDAHANDPLAGMELGDDDFGWITEMLVDIARENAGGRVISMLEGGYDLTALHAGTQRHVKALMA